MQRDNLVELARIENVPMSAVMGSEVTLIRAVQSARDEEPCFMSEKRLLCTVDRCQWRSECRRLVAVWKR